MFRELERGQRVFSGLLGWSGSMIPDVEVRGVFAHSNILAVSDAYYSELGGAPLLGRLLTLEDVNPHAGSTSQVAGDWLRALATALRRRAGCSWKASSHRRPAFYHRRCYAKVVYWLDARRTTGRYYSHHGLSRPSR
jgi:hypothetical protein